VAERAPGKGQQQRPAVAQQQHGIQNQLQHVREAVSYRGLFTVGWFSVREKHCSWLEIYDRLRASE